MSDPDAPSSEGLKKAFWWSRFVTLTVVGVACLAAGIFYADSTEERVWVIGIGLVCLVVLGGLLAKSSNSEW